MFKATARLYLITSPHCYMHTSEQLSLHLKIRDTKFDLTTSHGEDHLIPEANLKRDAQSI